MSSRSALVEYSYNESVRGLLQVGALEPEATTVSSTSHTQSTYLALRAS
jgi:hypothetical protein